MLPNFIASPTSSKTDSKCAPILIILIILAKDEIKTP